MLNTIQRNILEATFNYILLDIKENCRFPEAINALSSILDDNLYNDFKNHFEELGILASLNHSREIYRHPYPQNRAVGSSVGQEADYVVWEPNGHGNGIAKEPRGLLGLSAVNDSAAKPVNHGVLLLSHFHAH